MEYQVRAARITDIDRIVAIGDGESMRCVSAPLAARDLQHQLSDLPQASVLVTELRPGFPQAGQTIQRAVAAVGGAARRAN